MTPILWSFRRCPYAMRARLAIQSSGVQVHLREILLRDKPAAFLATSAKATVPVLDAGDRVIDQSRDIMTWALGQNDPEGWLEIGEETQALIDECDGPFKQALDHTKYAVRYPDLDETVERAKAAAFLTKLDDQLSFYSNLFGERPCLADFAIVPFVRQFTNTDRPWFDSQDWPHLREWLDRFLASARFANIMTKYPPWHSGQDEVMFPQT